MHSSVKKNSKSGPPGNGAFESFQPLLRAPHRRPVPPLPGWTGPGRAGGGAAGDGSENKTGGTGPPPPRRAAGVLASPRPALRCAAPPG